MDLDPKSDAAAADVLARAGARACGLCGAQALIPAQEAGPNLWFCFECGNEESQPPADIVLHSSID